MNFMDIKISCIILNGDNSICIKIISVKIFGLQLLRRNSSLDCRVLQSFRGFTRDLNGR
jgi:hypothetical protein